MNDKIARLTDDWQRAPRDEAAPRLPNSYTPPIPRPRYGAALACARAVKVIVPQHTQAFTYHDPREVKA